MLYLLFSFLFAYSIPPPPNLQPLSEEYKTRVDSLMHESIQISDQIIREQAKAFQLKNSLAELTAQFQAQIYQVSLC